MKTILLTSILALVFNSITIAQPGSAVNETAQQNSVFTYYLMQTLMNESQRSLIDQDGDGELTLHEVHEFVDRAAMLNEEQKPSFEQTLETVLLKIPISPSVTDPTSLSALLPSPIPTFEQPELSDRDIQDMVSRFRFNWPARGIKGSVRHQYEVNTVSGKNVVVNHTNQLMWQQSGSSDEMLWYQANEYIQHLNDEQYAGFSDWRLPTIEELASLLEASKLHKKTLFINPSFDITQAYCWSANPGRERHEAWIVIFINDGNIYPDDLTLKNYVRAVRAM